MSLREIRNAAGKAVGKTARFTFISMPASIFGWNLNKLLFARLRSYWKHTTSPVCPQCDHGFLSCDTSDSPIIDQADNGQQRDLYPWQCSHCDFVILGEPNAALIRETCSRIRADYAKTEIDEIEAQEREAISTRHKISSRLFYGFAFLIFLGFLYMTITGASIIVCINWLSFSFMFSVWGLKRSYRAWQILTGHVFEEGAFWYWLKNERWLT